ncbi:hypothetical protein BC628DRAFT_1309884 [Trametes gibbosa]|nr:hypothetical protein BC628DRAFT_1309884 [Trametes gibbosa]
MDNDHEAYILLLLSDSNLPTGSFVASAGLESYVTHGFFTDASSPSVPPPPDNTDYTINFVRDSLSTYAHSALPFVLDAHLVAEKALASTQGSTEAVVDRAIGRLKELDELYEAMTLNHVARRASKSQGVALLTLYTKGFSKPQLSRHLQSPGPASVSEARTTAVVDRLKLLVRREETHGHLPICWGVLTATLGLSSERSQYLHLFLQARSLLSASVRLNTIGPYASQQLLLHAVRPIVDAEMSKCKHLTTGMLAPSGSAAQADEAIHGPAMTWPLGEILASRHDLQHSRIFNS